MTTRPMGLPSIDMSRKARLVGSLSVQLSTVVAAVVESLVSGTSLVVTLLVSSVELAVMLVSD